MAKAFASQGDMSEKKISFTEVGEGLYAFTAEGDPNSGVIIGDDSVMIVEAQATPRLGKQGDRMRALRHRQADHACGADPLPRGTRSGGQRVWRATDPHVRHGPRHGRGTRVKKTGTASSSAFRACSKGMKASPA